MLLLVKTVEFQEQALQAFGFIERLSIYFTLTIMTVTAVIRLLSHDIISFIRDLRKAVRDDEDKEKEGKRKKTIR